MLGTRLLGKNSVWSQPHPDLMPFSGLSQSLSSVPCMPPKEGREEGHRGRATLMSALLPVASLTWKLPSLLFSHEHRVISGRLASHRENTIWYGVFSILCLQMPHRGEKLILSGVLCSFKSCDLAGVRFFLSTIHTYLCAHCKYPMLFGEHVLERGKQGLCKSLSRRLRDTLKQGGWLILSMTGPVPGG